MAIPNYARVNREPEASRAGSTEPGGPGRRTRRSTSSIVWMKDQ
jgi:hypothetical protein